MLLGGPDLLMLCFPCYLDETEVRLAAQLPRPPLARPARLRPLRPVRLPASAFTGPTMHDHATARQAFNHASICLTCFKTRVAQFCVLLGGPDLLMLCFPSCFHKTEVRLAAQLQRPPLARPARLRPLRPVRLPASAFTGPTMHAHATARQAFNHMSICLSCF